MKELNEQNFDQVVNESQVPVLIDFWAPWCGPCKALGPTIEKIAKEQDEKLLVCKVDIDQNPALAAKFSVMSIPTVILLVNGELKEQNVGLVNKTKLMKKIQPYL